MPTTVSNRVQTEFHAALRDRFGLRVALNDATFARVIDRVREEHGLGSDQVVNRLRHGERGDPAFDRIVELVTVPESYFFRDPAQFEWLRRHAMGPDALGRRRSFRAWSAGCCAGQELYTLGILLREQLGDAIDEWSITLLGTDVCETSLAIARSGEYFKGSLRASGRPDGCESWFEQLPEHRIRLDPRVVSMATFAALNFASDDYTDVVGAHTPFDLVICRNALMYLTVETVRHAVIQMARCIRPGGLLVLGPTDFVAMKIARSLGFEALEHRAFRRPRGAWALEFDDVPLPTEPPRPKRQMREPARPRAAASRAHRSTQNRPKLHTAAPASIAEDSDSAPANPEALAAAVRGASAHETLALLGSASAANRDLVAELLSAELWPAAMDLIHTQVAFVGRDPWLHVQSARAHIGLGDARGALGHGRTAVGLDERLSDAHFIVGVALLAQADRSGAEPEFARAVELDPRHSPARVALALLREGSKCSVRETLELHATVRGWKRPE